MRHSRSLDRKESLIVRGPDDQKADTELLVNLTFQEERFPGNTTRSGYLGIDSQNQYDLTGRA